MLSKLVTLLPLLAGAHALGGSHYMATQKNAVVNGKRAAAPEADPLGGSHYMANQNKAVYNKRGPAPAPVPTAEPEPETETHVEVLYVRDIYGNVMLDERGVPITTTTTVVVPRTSTNVVWVTEYVEPTATSVAPSATSSDCDESATPSATGSVDPSAVPSASVTASPVPSATGSGSASESSLPSATGSVEASGSLTSLVPSASGSADPSASQSASVTGSESASASASASATGSQLASASASATARESASASASASASSVESASATGSASASATESASAIGSESASATGSLIPSASAIESSASAIESSASASASASATASSAAASPTPLPSSASSAWWTPESTTSSAWWSPEQSSVTGSISSVLSSIVPSATVTSVPLSSAPASSSVAPSSTSSFEPLPTTSAIMNGYYADWTTGTLAPEDIDWKVYDVINYAFAIPQSDGSVVLSAGTNSILQRLVASAHAAGKRVVVSVGGWTGSAYFSTIVADNTLRARFVSQLVALNNDNNLDGIDIDWEYPGTMGEAGNAVSPQDSANYIIFLRELRNALPTGALITAATQVWPFYGANGAPMTDVSAFAEIFDWILIMNYDIWGSSSTPGPNAPLSDGCNNSAQPKANAHAAVAAWEAAGMPASKITLGVPGYGYLQISSANHLSNRRRSDRFLRKRADITLRNSEGGTTAGQINYNQLVKQGALTQDSNGSYVGSSGFTRYWDSCSSTPWLKSTVSGQIVTYDDEESLRLKGQFAKEKGIRGCSIWSLDGEYLNGKFPLSQAARDGMGI